MVVPLVALSLDASSTDAVSMADSAAAGAAYKSSPEFAAPKVAVETPSDEEFAMASRGEFNPPVALHSIEAEQYG
jgi:hypothetical protein